MSIAPERLLATLWPPLSALALISMIACGCAAPSMTAMARNNSNLSLNIDIGPNIAMSTAGGEWFAAPGISILPRMVSVLASLHTYLCRHDA